LLFVPLTAATAADAARFNIPLHTLQVILKTIFSANHVIDAKMQSS